MTTTPDQARRIVFPRRGEVALEPFEPPRPAADELLVGTLYSLMSIGTETTILHQRYDPDSHFARMFSFPQLQTGVQSVGVVHEAGPDVEDFAVGDVVYMRLGHGSHQVVSAQECSPVPDGLDLQQACWAGLAKTAFRAAWAAPFSSDSHVLIIGAGPVGQMAIRWAVAGDCSSVTVVDVAAERLVHARAGGADTCLQGEIGETLAAISQIDAGSGPNVVVDSTGNAAVFQPALAAAARFGKVILLGDTGFPGRQCLSSEVMTKGLTVQATHDSHDRDGWDQRRVDAHFFDLFKRGRFPLDGLITHEFAPEECREAYQLAETQREHTMGILYHWAAEE